MTIARMALPQAAYRTFLSLIVLSTLIASLVIPARAQHSVQLSWKPSTSSDVTIQQISRAPDGNCSGFVVIKYVSPKVSTWTDENVVSGQQYCYLLKAICSKPNCSPAIVSRPSNKIAVTIPD
jgi:hypothetical protein